MYADRYNTIDRQRVRVNMPFINDWQRNILQTPNTEVVGFFKKCKTYNNFEGSPESN